MVKPEIQHYDKLGEEIFPGDYVVAPYASRMSMIARVVKLNPKMLTILKLGARSSANTYPAEVVKLDPSKVTMYMLRNNFK